MAGFASFGMPMGNDNSAAAKKARKEGLARIALAKKNGYKGSGFIGGKSGPIMESTSIGDFVNRLARNYTVDVGDATSRTIQDTFLGGKGKSNVLDYSLVKPDTGFGILDAAIKYNPTNLLVGNLLNNSDFTQILAPGDVVPVEKVASLGLKGVKASPNILKGIKMAAGRTSPDVLSAASGGLLRGSPVRAARSAPEPDEFDKIINAAKAEDPTLGDVAPEGTAPAPFRSEADWDEGMSVNYAKAVKKIMDDLEPSYQKLLDDGEDPAIIDPLVDDSIAALHSEIGNLSTARYNHNDLEDFLGRVAAPDDYIVADSWLAKRADNFVHDLGVEYEAWGRDTDKWLQEAGYGVDPEAFRGLLDDIGMDAANSAAKVVDETVNSIDKARITEGFVATPPTPEVVGNIGRGGAFTHKLDPEEAAFRANNAAEFIPKDVIREESEQILSILGPLGRDDKPVDAITVYSMSREELLQRTRDALSSIKTRERNLNKKRIAKGLEPYKYEEHFNPDNFTLEEFRTLWGSGNMYVFNAAGEKIPELGLHLGHGAVPLEQGGSVTLGQVRGEIGVGNIRRGNRGAALDASKQERQIKKYLVKTFGADDPITKDPDVVEWIKEASIASKAEKVSDPSTWTTAQRAAYDAGDWKTFSSLRGYTPDEIAQFEKYMMLSEKIAKKYEQDGTSIFDPDLEKFLKTL